MSTYKTTSGDYIITCNSGSGNLTINANLDVVGNITYIESSELKIDDPFITVAANNTGTVTSMGMVAQKSGSTYAGLRFNTITNEWEISPSVTETGGAIFPYVAISTSSGTPPAGANTQVQFNNNGAFGASASLTFDNANNQLTLSGTQAFGNIGTGTPTAVANSVVVYNKAPGIGASGLYVVSSTVNSELISATQAKLFSIIF